MFVTVERNSTKALQVDKMGILNSNIQNVSLETENRPSKSRGYQIDWNESTLGFTEETLLGLVTSDLWRFGAVDSKTDWQKDKVSVQELHGRPNKIKDCMSKDDMISYL